MKKFNSKDITISVGGECGKYLVRGLKEMTIEERPITDLEKRAIASLLGKEVTIDGDLVGKVIDVTEGEASVTMKAITDDGYIMKWWVRKSWLEGVI